MVSFQALFTPEDEWFIIGRGRRLSHPVKPFQGLHKLLTCEKRELIKMAKIGQFEFGTSFA